MWLKYVKCLFCWGCVFLDCFCSERRRLFVFILAKWYRGWKNILWKNLQRKKKPFHLHNIFFLLFSECMCGWVDFFYSIWLRWKNGKKSHKNYGKTNITTIFEWVRVCVKKIKCAYTRFYLRNHVLQCNY